MRRAILPRDRLSLTWHQHVTRQNDAKEEDSAGSNSRKSASSKNVDDVTVASTDDADHHRHHQHGSGANETQTQTQTQTQPASSANEASKGATDTNGHETTNSTSPIGGQSTSNIDANRETNRTETHTVDSSSTVPPKKSFNSSAIIAGVILGCFAIILILILFVWFRRKREAKRMDVTGDATLEKPHFPMHRLSSYPRVSEAGATDDGDGLFGGSEFRTSQEQLWVLNERGHREKQAVIGRKSDAGWNYAHHLGATG